MKFFFLMLAILGTICFIGLGVAIAEESIAGMIASVLLLLCIMGIGFSKKKKMREKESV
ncbi:DUF5325 family protein [Niallia sp. XMNu-256]|uniref:DUF5325 family protein n=1 Tax=Niallia sp. XMNu-256 TaxID=3082444 RepID=UPI0030D36C11